VFTAFGRPLVNDVRLICLPYAGGTANSYRRWVGRLPDVDVLAAYLPGRDRRFSETPATRFEPLLDDLLVELVPYLDTQFCLFGHSMGGLLAYELARRLEAQGRAPKLVVASGTAAPGLFTTNRDRTVPDDESLLATVRRDADASGEILANAELMTLLLPVLRADLGLVADYVNRPEPPLRSPLILYYGRDEVLDPTLLVKQWAPAAARTPVARSFAGGHLFVDQQSEAVLAQLADDVRESVEVSS
jgi:medium-chain acyl-[acyl-carrier-protein] hydrolase